MVNFSRYVQIFFLCFFYHVGHTAPPARIDDTTTRSNQVLYILKHISRHFSNMLGDGHSSEKADKLVAAIDNPQEYEDQLRRLHAKTSKTKEWIYGNRNDRCSDYFVAMIIRGSLLNILSDLEFAEVTNDERSQFSCLVAIFNKTISSEVSTDVQSRIEIPDRLNDYRHVPILLTACIKSMENSPPIEGAQMEMMRSSLPPEPGTFTSRALFQRTAQMVMNKQILTKLNAEMQLQQIQKLQINSCHPSTLSKDHVSMSKDEYVVDEDENENEDMIVEH